MNKKEKEMREAVEKLFSKETSPEELERIDRVVKGIIGK